MNLVWDNRVICGKRLVTGKEIVDWITKNHLEDANVDFFENLLLVSGKDISSDKEECGYEFQLYNDKHHPKQRIVKSWIEVEEEPDGTIRDEYYDEIVEAVE